MFKIKVNYRHRVVWETLFFCVLLLLTVYVNYCLVLERAVLDTTNLTMFVNQFSSLFIFLGLCLFFIYKVANISRVFFLVFIASCFYENFWLLTIRLDKVALLVNFLMASGSYFFFLSWKSLLKLACYNPNLSKHNLEIPTLYEIPVLIKTLNSEIGGVLTNWDDLSCFVKIEKPLSESSLVIKTTIGGKEFEFKGLLASRFMNNGVGIIFENSDNEDWNDFIEIFESRGINSNLVVLK